MLIIVVRIKKISLIGFLRKGLGRRGYQHPLHFPQIPGVGQ